MSVNALLVFAKVPQPGQVKTRLLGVLRPEQAADLHRACLVDTVQHMKRIPGCHYWMYVAARTDSAQRLAETLALDHRWHVAAQHGRNLGERFQEAFDSLFRRGYRKVVVVGTDTPWMGSERMARAFRALDTDDVVLAPAADGGYYLAGARRPVPQMFRNIPWSTSQVLDVTLLALEKSGVSYRLLQRDFDLDRPEDLQRAADLLRGEETRAPALAEFLQKLQTDAISRSSRRPKRAPQRKKRRPVRA